MEITNSAVEWDEQEDREIFAQFLRTRTGQRLLPKVVESAPTLLAGGGVNEILIRSGELRGFQLAVSSMLALSATIIPDITPAVGGAYASPEDDAAWGDGKKVNP